MVIWITGLSGSGKSFLSTKIKKKINQNFIIIDGDVIRNIFNNDLGHTRKDRKINAMRISKLVEFLSNNGLNIIVPVLSIFPEWLKWNRKNIKNYFEIFINVSLDDLIKRNSKKIYKKNKKLNKNIVGLDIKFPIPKNPDLVLQNSFNQKSLNENIKIIEKFLRIKNLI
jgi:adenylylsulfate kinase